MREIRLPNPRPGAIPCDLLGDAIVFAVVVDWPELQLTEAQHEENAIARALGGQPPHEDHAVFTVTVPREWLSVETR